MSPEELNTPDGRPKDVRQMSKNASLAVSDSVVKLIRLLLWAANVVLLFVIVFSKILSRTLRTFMLYAPHLVGKIMPKKTESNLDQQLVYAGVDMSSDEVVGLTLVYSVVVTLTVYLVATGLGISPYAISMSVIAAFLGVWIAPFLIITILISKRVDNVEKMLPDILSIVSQNMAAGMTTYNALWSAARPEFGPCAEELQLAAKDTLTGTPLQDALYAITHRVRSERLARSIRLIIQGINSGGDLPEVLESISTDMRMEFNLRDQMASETSAQALFIIFATIVGAPLLLAVSLQFITIFSTLMDKLDVASLSENLPDQAMMFSLSTLSITPTFFKMYAVLLLGICAFFAAMLVGMLKTGTPISGVPQIPIFIICSIGVFFLIKFILDSVFGSMLVI